MTENEDTSDYSEYETEKPVVDLNVLAKLATEQKKAELDVSEAEEVLKSAKAVLKDISEHKFPELMDSLGLKIFETDDGLKIKIDEKIRASIPAAGFGLAEKWLTDNGHAGIIKNEVKMQFAAGQFERASKITKELTELGYEPQSKKSVHASTLASFVKTQLEEGIDIPMKTFGAFKQRSTKVS